MKNAAELLVGALARVLADDRRVMLAGDSFELLQLLADAPVKELVVVSPLVAEVDKSGTTASGAPLQMRPDWQARSSSKDLIIDLTGEAPPAEVVRVLKKAGLYLSPISNPVLEALSEVTAITGRLGAAVICDGADLRAQRLDGGLAGEPVQAWLGAKTHLIVPPGLICTLPAELTPNAADPELDARVTDLESALEAARAQVETLGRIEKALEDAEAQLGAQARSLEAAEELGKRALALEDEVNRLKAAAQDGAAAASRLTELEAEYSAVRDELAARRVDDRRFALLKARFDAARTELIAEVDGLRDQLREVGEPAADSAALLGERDAARRALTAVTGRLVPALSTHLALPFPKAPPAWSGAALDAWLDAACDLLAAQSGRGAIEVTARTVVVPPIEPPPAAPLDPAAVPLVESANAARIALLQAELDTVRADRAAAEAAWAERLAAARAALADRGQLVAELQGQQRRATDEHRRRLAAEDDQARLQAEIALRAQRIVDLEAIVATHVRMEGLMTEALDAAEVAREDACTEQRALAANLRVLQGEFERLVGAEQPDRQAAERARAAEDRAAAAERKLAAAEERIARLEAERAVRSAD